MSRELILRISLPVLTFLAAWLGGLSTYYTDWSWYESLNKSSLNPPNYLFGIVWPILYTLMAIVSFLHAKLIYKWYIPQLLLNSAWSWLFFCSATAGNSFYRHTGFNWNKSCHSDEIKSAGCLA